MPAAERRAGERSTAAIGIVVREALARAGADPAAFRALGHADAAAAALAAIPDTPRLRRADNALISRPGAPDPGPHAEAFDAQIATMAARCDPDDIPDPTSASLAMLFAWALAMLRAHPHPASRGKRASGVAAPGISAHAERA